MRSVDDCFDLCDDDDDEWAAALVRALAAIEPATEIGSASALAPPPRVTVLSPPVAASVARPAIAAGSTRPAAMVVPPIPRRPASSTLPMPAPRRLVVSTDAPLPGVRALARASERVSALPLGVTPVRTPRLVVFIPPRDESVALARPPRRMAHGTVPIELATATDADLTDLLDLALAPFTDPP